MVITGKAYWAWVTVPNTTYEPAYTIDVVLEDEQADKLTEEGYNVKTKDYGRSITIKRKVSKKDGTQRPVPKLMDATKQPFNAAVGNGSDVKVQCRPWEMEINKKMIRGFELQAVQVLSLVPYAGADGEEFDIEDFDAEGEL